MVTENEGTGYTINPMPVEGLPVSSSNISHQTLDIHFTLGAMTILLSPKN